MKTLKTNTTIKISCKLIDSTKTDNSVIDTNNYNYIQNQIVNPTYHTDFINIDKGTNLVNFGYNGLGLNVKDMVIDYINKSVDWLK